MALLKRKSLQQNFGLCLILCGLQLKIMSTTVKKIKQANKCVYTCALANSIP